MAWQAVIALLCLAVCQVNGQDPAQMCTGIGGEVKDCSACNGGCIKDQNIDTPLGCCVGNNLINPNQCSAMMGIVKDSCSACSNQSCATLSSDKACCFERPDTPSVEDVKKCAAAKGIIKECKDCDTGCFSGENGGSMGCCIPTVTADMCQRDGKLGTTCNDCEDDQECAHLPENRVCCLPEAEDADVKMCTDNGGMIKDCSNCTGGCVRDMGESMGCCFGERLTSSGECTGMLGLVKESCSNCADQLCSTLTDEQNKACCFEREWEEDMRKCAKAGGQTTECDTCSTGCFKGDSDGPFGCCIPTVTATMCQQHGKLGSSCDDCEDEDECAHLPGNSICCLPKAQDGEGMCDLENLLAFIAKNPSTYACLQNMNSLFDGTISKQDACGVFWDGMQCFTQLYLQGSMGTITQAACFKDLKDDIMEEKDGYQKIRRALIKEFRMAIIVPGFVATKCEESWNVPCPMLERDEDSGLCPQECGSASSCGDGKVCCPFSCGEDSSGNLCAPDMTKCANVDDITTYAFSCIELFGKLIGESDFESFCKYSWGGFECVARELVGDPYKDMCLRRMAHLVEASPDIIVQQIKLLAPGLDIDQALANRTASCPQNPMSLKKETPVADDVKSCGDAAQIRQAFNRGKCRAPGSSEINEDNCEAFEDMLECVAERLIGDDDDNAGKLRGRCMNTIVQVIKDNFFQFKEILSSGPFNHEKCREMAAVCMGDTKPSETANCRGNSKCPKGFNCVAGYCCPQANAGVCPTYKDQIPPCRGRCKQDSDCDDEEKCCNVGCNGGMTCVPAEIEDQSKCEKEFGQVKMLLENMGVCGDGVSDLQIPRCQDKKFHPTQGRYCVDENGEKIPGSEHMGVKDCTRVHAGMCQAMPAVCKNLGTPNKTNSIINCENDGECADNEKCCMDGSSNVCEVKCMPALSAETNRQADEDCANPVCCPVTTCLGKVCAADVTAVCQIHACGECTAKFYNKDGEVDCEAGVKKCVKERFSALEHNSKIGKTTRDKLNTLIESLRKRGSGENKKDADDMDDMEDEMDDMMDDDFMDGEDMTDVAEEYRQKVAYILKKMPKDPSHGTISFDMKKLYNEVFKFLAAASHHCAVMNKYNICQNSGTCALLVETRSKFQFCTCQSGFHGLLCEKSGDLVSPMDSKCNRDKEYVMSIKEQIETAVPTKYSVIMSKMIAFYGVPDRILPSYNCASDGSYNEVQTGIFHTKDKRVEVHFCVNTTTGDRLPNKLVIPTSFNRILPDCAAPGNIDISRLPLKCMYPKQSDCTSGNCQYFLNPSTFMCEKGEAASNGFASLNECYETCALIYMCANATSCSYVSAPVPCHTSSGWMCDYHKEYCDVEDDVNNIPGGGVCKSLPEYCLLEKDAGYGDRIVGRYFYDATSRTCKRFAYFGMGGNQNRFETLHQCHTECGPRSYKYDDVTCPSPDAVRKSLSGMKSYSTCDSDDQCMEGEVCCSNGKYRVCTNTVKFCPLGDRCSHEGACEMGKCVCPMCEKTTGKEVCGSDGMTYGSECMLRRHACMMMQTIKVASTQPCAAPQTCNGKVCRDYEICSGDKCVCPKLCTEQYEPVCAMDLKTGAQKKFSNKCFMNMEMCMRQTEFNVGECPPNNETCVMACTREYKPLCAYHTSSNTMETVPNKCELLRMRVCEGKTLEVLYSGECAAQCGNTQCSVYQDCIDGMCKCSNICPLIMDPVCAFKPNNPDQKKTFANECVMRRAGCNEAAAYMIYERGACVKPEPMLKCPEMDMDIPHSSEFACNIDNNERCDDDTEMCCPYGTGSHCVPKSGLAKKDEVKEGFCPMITVTNFDEGTCADSSCDVDADCAGNMKCCMNDVCTHMTCVLPRQPRANVCGNGKKPVGQCDPLSTEPCADGGSCNSTVIDGMDTGVCCVSSEAATRMMDMMAMDKDAALQQKLCHIVDLLGMCPTGQKCIGDLKNGQLCGFYETCASSVPCFLAPCDEPNAMCPKVPEATCMDNYCFGCNKIFMVGDRDVTHMCQATLCERQNHTFSMIWEKIFNDNTERELAEARQTVLNEMIKNKLPMDVDWDEIYDNINADVFYTNMIQLLKHMGYKHIWNNQEGYPACTDNGLFEKKQCFIDPKEVKKCRCVDENTGMQYGPAADDVDSLDCSIAVPDDVCLTVPNLEESCDDTSVTRYYYNHDMSRCEAFADMGCNYEISNNFADMESCTARCEGGGSSQCQTNCAEGTKCVIMKDKEICMPMNQDVKRRFEPICERSGEYETKQCHHGVCRCVNPLTGEAIPNSLAFNQQLRCIRNGDTVTPQRDGLLKMCPNGGSPKLCENGGLPCNDCQMPQAGEGEDDEDDGEVKPDGTCSECAACPNGQGNTDCPATCNVDSVCKERPLATCRINKCTCAEQFVENGKIINDCKKAQSLCEMMKTEMAMKQRANNGKANGQGAAPASKQYRCSEGGSFEALCEGNACFCVNATDGSKIGGAKSGDIDSIDCEQEQKRSKPKYVKVKGIVAKNKNLADLSAKAQQQIIDQIRKIIEEKGGRATIKLMDGSIIYEATIEEDGSGTDVTSVSSSFVAQMNGGVEIMTDEGVIEIPTGTSSIAEFIIAEPTTEKPPPNKDEKDDKTVIIIVVVVVVVVALIAVCVAVYCYKKSKKTDDKDMQFSNIHGKPNPAYENQGYDKAAF
ncbi:uncharacterized protein LOC128223771 [Mya arenaria]|uniref:uncharacterized protein LOC128223771 n=1 Tax=Mya arenaria TaxID=6604 RepID=UPI0022E53858|nr:uncharacterized protein LOC128223771 [Mya arenaria]XP_052789103.1 uncharacterized protein LOC128223771 [Mya arenaria]XP_052789104.1 uncharacterized protein LOC128223771 [Mya arenaria]